jgi:hypothetical protein
LNENKNILISPLDWGLGHAARIIPVAKYFIDNSHVVTVAAGDQLRSFLESELPGTRFIRLEGFRPSYSAILPQYLVLLLQVPVLLWKSVREHFIVKKIISDYKIDIIISDNRFGLWHKNIRSVYITHMPRIPFPYPFRFLEFIGIAMHRLVMSRYSLCLIPDLPGEVNLTGRLSHGLKLLPNTRFAGFLSRFRLLQGNPAGEMSIAEQAVVILSGPEPQRSILSGRLNDHLHRSGIPAIFLHGRPGKPAAGRTDNISHFAHLPSDDIKNLLLTSRYIICRSGYTTIMELASLQKTAVIIPTPGQTEQEYLAGYLSERNYFTGISQDKIGELKLTDCPNSALPSSALEESDLLFLSAVKKILEE